MPKDNLADGPVIERTHWHCACCGHLLWYEKFASRLQAGDRVLQGDEAFQVEAAWLEGGIQRVAVRRE